MQFRELRGYILEFKESESLESLKIKHLACSLWWLWADLSPNELIKTWELRSLWGL